MTEKQRAKLEAEAKKKLSDMRKNAASEMKLREEKLERLRVRFFKVPYILGPCLYRVNNFGFKKF